MGAGELLTRWTVRAAVGFYLARLLLDAAPVSASSARVGRLLWTAGCVCYLAHVAAAFHVFHGWSHADALRFTAEQTERTVGLAWGGGLYFNYAFTLLWLTDAGAWWLLGRDYPRRHRATYWVVQGVFAFMVFNATVVFGPAFWRWVAALFAAVLAGVLLWRRPRGATRLQRV